MPEAEKVQLKINCNMELKNADNLHIFKQVQSVPEDAQKPFESPWGKRLTEIDPFDSDPVSVRDILKYVPERHIVKGDFLLIPAAAFPGADI